MRDVLVATGCKLVATGCKEVDDYLWLARDIVPLQRRLEQAEKALAQAGLADRARLQAAYDEAKRDNDAAWEAEIAAYKAAAAANPRMCDLAAADITAMWDEFYTRTR